MNLFYIMAFIALQFMCFMITAPECRECTLLKRISVSMTLFNIEYFFFSVIFLWCDVFSVDYILLSVFLLNLTAIILRWKTIKKSVASAPFIKFVNSDLIMAALLVLILPMTFVKSEDIRTSSDMGMYFSKLTVLLNKDTSTVRQLSEMGEISPQVDEGVLALQEQLVGINVRSVGENGHLEYDYHSMPTWVALMALFAKMFGIFHATQVLTYLYILSILLCYFICEKIGCAKNNKFLAVILFALSPVVLYVSKCTLTEITYAQLLLAGIFLMTLGNRYFYFLSGICLGLLGFVHFSTYIYWPGIYVCLLMLMLLSREKKYGIINLIYTGMFTLSLLYAHDVSYAYMRSQLTDRLWFISRELKVLVIVISAVCLLTFLIQLGLCLAGSGIQNALRTVLLKCLPIVLMIMVAAILIGSIWNGYHLGFTDKLSVGGGSWAQRKNYLNQGFTALKHLNLINIMKANGWVCIPVIFVYLFIRKNKDSMLQNVIAFALLYSILLYTYASIDTPINYYASRYFTPVIIPMITLFMATIMKPVWFYRLIITWCVIYSVRYDYIMVYRASFAGQYGLWEDICENIPQNSIVLANEKSQQLNVIAINNLRELNDCLVFNYTNEQEVAQRYSERNIYILSDKAVKDSGYQLLLCKNYKIMGNLGAADADYMTEEASYSKCPVYIYKKKEQEK